MRFSVVGSFGLSKESQGIAPSFGVERFLIFPSLEIGPKIGGHSDSSEVSQGPAG